MRSALLNPNQARHLASVLGLLLDDLAELAAGLPLEPWAAPVRQQIHQISIAVHQLLRRLDLVPPGRADPRQRLMAYTGIWLARLHDLRAESLAAYGQVAPGLAAVLNPDLQEIARQLEELAQLAKTAP